MYYRVVLVLTLAIWMIGEQGNVHGTTTVKKSTMITSSKQKSAQTMSAASSSSSKSKTVVKSSSSTIGSPPKPAIPAKPKVPPIPAPVKKTGLSAASTPPQTKTITTNPTLKTNQTLEVTTIPSTSTVEPIDDTTPASTTSSPVTPEATSHTPLTSTFPPVTTTATSPDTMVTSTPSSHPTEISSLEPPHSSSTFTIIDTTSLPEVTTSTAKSVEARTSTERALQAGRSLSATDDEQETTPKSPESTTFTATTETETAVLDITTAAITTSSTEVITSTGSLESTTGHFETTTKSDQSGRSLSVSATTEESSSTTNGAHGNEDDVTTVATTTVKLQEVTSTFKSTELSNSSMPKCVATAPRLNIHLDKMLGLWHPAKISTTTSKLWLQSFQKPHNLSDIGCLSVEYSMAGDDPDTFYIALHAPQETQKLEAIFVGDDKHPKESKWAISWPNGEDTLTSVVAAGVVGKDKSRYAWLLTVDCDLNGIIEPDWTVFGRLPDGLSKLALDTIIAIVDGLQGLKVEDSLTYYQADLDKCAKS